MLPTLSLIPSLEPPLNTNTSLLALTARNGSNPTPRQIGRLAQGTLPDMPSGTNTIFFICHPAVPTGRKATYLRIVSTIRPGKKENKRTRFTVGGNHIDYPGKVNAPTADITTVKCLLNSVISTPDVKFMTIDLANF
jgi:hypothetical protein